MPKGRIFTKKNDCLKIETADLRVCGFDFRNETVEVASPCVSFHDCDFGHFTGTPNQSFDGLRFAGGKAVRFEVSSSRFHCSDDEMASVVNGATNGTFRNCVFTGGDKGFLAHDERADATHRFPISLTFINCVFDEVARRSIRGKHCHAKFYDCEFIHWSEQELGYKSYACQAEDYSKFMFYNCHWETKIKLDLVDWFRGGGFWQIARVDRTSSAVFKNCTTNMPILNMFLPSRVGLYRGNSSGSLSHGTSLHLAESVER